jgi:hypothetical protein
VEQENWGKVVNFWKQTKPQALAKKSNSYMSSIQIFLKVLLIGVAIVVIIFLIVKAISIAQWIAQFLTGIYEFFSCAIDWIPFLVHS